MIKCGFRSSSRTSARRLRGGHGIRDTSAAVNVTALWGDRGTSCTTPNPFAVPATRESMHSTAPLATNS